MRLISWVREQKNRAEGQEGLLWSHLCDMTETVYSYSQQLWLHAQDQPTIKPVSILPWTKLVLTRLTCHWGVIGTWWFWGRDILTFHASTWTVLIGLSVFKKRRYEFRKKMRETVWYRRWRGLRNGDDLNSLYTYMKLPKNKNKKLWKYSRMNKNMPLLWDKRHIV